MKYKISFKNEDGVEYSYIEDGEYEWIREGEWKKIISGSDEDLFMKRLKKLLIKSDLYPPILFKSNIIHFRVQKQ